jgi:hypothetical protein
MENTNLNDTRGYYNKDKMSVDRYEINKDDAWLPSKITCTVIFLSGYIVSIFLFIKEIIIFRDGSTANLETIITGATGIVFQLAGFLMFYWLYYKFFQDDHYVLRASSSFFTLYRIKFIFSIIELLFIIFLQPKYIEGYSGIYFYTPIIFIVLAVFSGVLHILMITSSIYFLVTIRSKPESYYRTF